MKVLLYHPYFFVRGGAEKLILEYLKRSKYKFDILTWYVDYSVFPELEKYNVIILLPEIVHKIARKLPIKSFPYLLSLLLDFKSVLENYDLILVSTAGLVETSLIKNYTDNIVFYCHTPLKSAYYWDFKRNLTYRFRNPVLKLIYKIGVYFYNKLEKKAWKRVKFVIFNSELTRRRALDKGLVDKERTKVIYPGVEIPKFDSYKTENYFLYVSRIDFHKRQHIVLKAWKKFVKKYKDYRLILAGSLGNPSYVKFVLNLAKQTENVSVLTDLPYERILDLYSKSLATINIPFMEDFGIVPLEASAAGKYVINAYPAGNYELLRDFPGIYWIKEKFYDEKMIEEVYKAMEFFVKNQNELIELGRENRKWIEKLDLSWERFAKEMDKTLDLILKTL